MRRLTTGLVALSLALLAAGCGDGGDGGSTPTSGSDTTSETASGGSSDAVAWADKVCSAMKDDVAGMTATPNIDMSNAQAAKDGVLEYLGKLETALDGVVGAVQDAGTPPVEGGDEAVKGVTDAVGSAKEAVSSAKAKIDAAPVNDPAGFQAAFSSAQEDLTKLTELDPTASFDANKELKDAYDKAPACQELESGSSTTPTS